jgi:hypothetical protein
MDNWRRYIELRIRAKTGLGSGVFVWALIALLGAVVTCVFVLVTTYIWLAERYEPFIAALMLSGLFLLITIIAIVACIWTHNRIIARAELELATRRSTPWLDPRLMAGALQASRAVGGPKLVALAAVTLVAVGIGMQWMRHDKLAAINGGSGRPFTPAS